VVRLACFGECNICACNLHRSSINGYSTRMRALDYGVLGATPMRIHTQNKWGRARVSSERLGTNKSISTPYGVKNQHLSRRTENYRCPKPLPFLLNGARQPGYQFHVQPYLAPHQHKKASPIPRSLTSPHPQYLPPTIHIYLSLSLSRKE
jgi:hypothetical protein